MLPKDALTKLLIEQAINQLNSASKSVELFRSEMKRLAQQLPEYAVVMDMYGVGDTLGSQLMAEIGDVMRFERGAPELQKNLFLVIDTFIKKAPPDDPVSRFMDKKRAYDFLP